MREHKSIMDGEAFQRLSNCKLWKGGRQSVKWKPIFAPAYMRYAFSAASTFFAAFCGQVVVITRYIRTVLIPGPYKGIGHGVMQNYFWNFMAACLFYVNLPDYCRYGGLIKAQSGSLDHPGHFLYAHRFFLFHG